MHRLYPSDEEIERFYDRISDNIRRLRQERGISQLDMALSLGQNSSAFYANAENRRHGKHFNLEHLYRLAPVLEVEIEELIKRS